MPLKDDLRKIIYKGYNLDKKIDGVLDYFINFEENKKNGLEEPLEDVIYEAVNTFTDYFKDHPSRIKDANNNQFLNEFLRNPTINLKLKLASKVDEYNKNNEIEKANKAQDISLKLDSCIDSFAVNVSKNGDPWKKLLDKRKKKFISLTESKFSNKKTFDKAIEDNKAGWWEKLWRRTSPEYKALIRAINEYKDPTSNNYGNTNILEATTKAYLAHKLPSYNGQDDNPNYEEARNLNSKSRSRVDFAKSILESIKDTRRTDAVNDKIDDANEYLVNDQADFQNKIQESFIEKENVNENEINTNIEKDIIIEEENNDLENSNDI